MIALRSSDNVYCGSAPEDLFALRLGDAAGDCDFHLAAIALSRAFDGAHASEFGIDLIDRLLADVTGVENDEIGFLRALALTEALGLEHVRHTIGIVDVHLAAK